MAESLSRTLARFSHGLDYQGLPPQVVDKIKASLLHQLIIAIIGADTTRGRAAIQFAKTEEAYANFAEQYPDFGYQHLSLKSSIYSIPLTFMGYGGYLNPFTNEAQVNGVTPKFRLPTVSCHEVGHQLGYSAEGATNFIGYLVTSESNDPYFKYSAYNHALGYCLTDLFHKDEEKYNEIVGTINMGVKENFNELRDFWEKYENPMEPIFKSVFNTFLKANNQKEGIKSYNAVVGLMINYRKQQMAIQ